jgi:hypothetical protein
MRKRDLTGKLFGRLTVVEEMNERKDGRVVYKCSCSCGNFIEVKNILLTTAKTKSCGCLTTQIDLKNKKYGKLLVLNEIKKRDKYGNVMWECLCDCGNKKNIQGASLRQGLTKTCNKCRTTKYYNKNDFMIGVTPKGQEFYFDKDDYEKIKMFVWHVDRHGYVETLPNNKHTKLHKMITQTNSKENIDHVNGNKLDNRKMNLRKCTICQNNMNRGIGKGNKSGYKGVSWDLKNKKWRVSISYKGKMKNLGRYDDIKEAAIKYNEKALELYCEFAKLNEIYESL